MGDNKDLDYFNLIYAIELKEGVVGGGQGKCCHQPIYCLALKNTIDLAKRFYVKPYKSDTVYFSLIVIDFKKNN